MFFVVVLTASFSPLVAFISNGSTISGFTREAHFVSSLRDASRILSEYVELVEEFVPVLESVCWLPCVESVPVGFCCK